MQLIMFGNEVEQFFIAKLDNEPLPGHEEAVTEELYQVALQSRMCGGEPRDYEHFDYQPEQDAMSKPRPPMIIKTMGYDDGYEGRFPRERDARYLEEHAWGREQRASEHPDNISIIFESPGMTNYARRGKAGTQ
jgi:hypothetical protein